MRRARSWTIALIGVSILAIGLSACGGDDQFGEGSAAPGFSLPESAGGTVALADFGDEPVLLYFHMADG